jgi:tetratricopeptide (TPR) repeat protein
MAGETLEGMLTDCTKEQLCGLAREFGLKGYSRLDKGGLVSFLLEKADHAALKDRLLAPISPAPAVKEKKEKRMSKMAIWGSILGVPLAVIGLVVGIILSSSSDKQLNDVKTKLDRFDPITHDKVLKEKDELLTEKEKKIKELEKAVAELCVGAPQERKDALEELKNGNMEKARALLKRAIDAQCGVLAGDYYQMGNAYFVDKKPDYRAALAAYLEAERLGPGNGEYLNMVGVAYNALGEYGRAKDYFESAMAIRKKVSGEQHPDVATSLNNMGSVYTALGDQRKAISYYEQALTIDEVVFGKEHPNVAIRLNNLGLAYAALGDLRKAISYYEQALAIDEAVFGKEHPDVATDLNNLGSAYYALGDNRKAISYYEQALDIWKKVYGEQHPQVATGLNNLGEAWRVLGGPKNAISYYEQALAIDEAVFGKEHPNVARDLNNLGAAYFQMGKKDKARPYFEKAYAIFKQFYGDDHPQTKNAKRWLEKCR